MIEIKKLTKSFGKLRVLNGVDINFNEPGVYSVLGPNGSGKTTMIKSILGMVLPDDGDIYFNGERIAGNHKYRKEISYLPQIAQFPEHLTGRELISMVKDIRKQNGSEKGLIEMFDLKDHLDKNLKYLSGGNKQKINLTLALMFDSPVIIFDEPTAGLDPVALLRFKALVMKLRDEGKIIILTTHITVLVEEISDKIVFLLDGNIYFSGDNKDLLKDQNSDSLEKAIAKIMESKN